MTVVGVPAWTRRSSRPSFPPEPSCSGFFRRFRPLSRGFLSALFLILPLLGGLSPEALAQDPEVNLSVSGSGQVIEGGNALTITATRSEANASGAALSIPIQVKSADTTADSSDYTLAASISIPDNAATGTATFTVTDDSTVEGDETVVVELGTPPAGTVAGTTDEVTITIIDDDDTHTISVSLAASGLEGDSEHTDYRVTLTADPPILEDRHDAYLDVCFTGTAEHRTGLYLDGGGNALQYETDFRTVDGGNSNLPLGSATGCIRVDSAFNTLYGYMQSTLESGGMSLRVLGDARVEPDETVIVTISRRTGMERPTPSDILVHATANTATHTITNDDGGPGVVISKSSLSLTELGGAAATGTYTAKLKTDPGSGVTVTVTAASGDTDVATVSPASLTFAGGSGAPNWATARTFTVTAVNDGDAGNESVNITHAATASSGSGPYHNIVPAPVAVTVTDAGHGVIASESALSVDEDDDTDTYTLRLASDPGNGTVTLTPASDDTDVATVSAAVSFTSGDWQTPKSITVTGKETGSAGITHAINPGTTAYPTSFTPLPTLSVTVADVAMAIGGPHEVASDWALKPSGLSPGDSFRLLFVTSEWHNAESAAVSRYNRHVQYWADTTRGHAAINAYKDDVRAVASTATVDAIDNVDAPTATTGIPIYWMDAAGGGAKVADDYADFWDGSWDNYAGTDRRSEDGLASTGQTPADWPWTGTADDGTATAHPLGSATPTRGALPNNSPLDHGAAGRAGAASRHTLYALSPVFTVAQPAPALTAGGITMDGATITLSNISGSWHYKTATGGACSSVQTGGSFTLSSLSANTSYTYAVYDDAACTNELARITFTTLATTTVLSMTMATAAADEGDGGATATYPVTWTETPAWTGANYKVDVCVTGTAEWRFGAISGTSPVQFHATDFRLVDDTDSPWAMTTGGCLSGGLSPSQVSNTGLRIKPTGDADDESDETVTLTLSRRTGTTDPTPAGVTISPTAGAVTFTIENDDGDGVALSETALSLTELHASDGVKTYTAKLKTDPGSGVTVTVTATSGDTDVATVSPASLTFAGGSGAPNWATARTFTVTAVNDGDAGNEPEFDIAHSVTASGSAAPYHGIAAAPVKVTVTDAGHGVVASASALDVRENDGAATYTLALKSQPGGNVTVRPATSDATHATVSGDLVFTNANWKTPQTVTVTGKGSATDTATITHSIQATNDATNYPTNLSGLPEVAVTVTADTRPMLSADGITMNGATITLRNISGTWYHKRTTAGTGTCSSAQTGTSFSLTSLTAGIDYTWAVSWPRPPRATRRWSSTPTPPRPATAWPRSAAPARRRTSPRAR